MKKVLLLDTNISAKPILDFLLSTGHKVYIGGGNPNDSLAKSSPNYINFDYSNLDELESVIDSLTIDFLVPGGNDMSYEVCSRISEKYSFFNIDSVQTNRTINDKARFRRFASKIGLKVPMIYDDFSSVLGKDAVIVKPVDGYSGRGISVLHSPDESDLNEALALAQRSSKSSKCLIEEYVEGQLYSHSAFIVNQKIVIDFVVEEHCTLNKFAVDTSRVIHNFDMGMLNAIRENIQLMVSELNLQDGLVHSQFISNYNNFWIIEVTRRCPGDLYSLLIELSTGIPYAALYAKPFLNLKNDNLNISKQTRHVFRHTLSVPANTVVYGIKYNNSFKHDLFFSYVASGDIIKASPTGRIGILFGSEESESKFDKVYINAVNRKLYSVV